MEQITFCIDVIVLVVTLWTLFKIASSGKVVAGMFRMIGVGVVLIGLAQVVETAGLTYTTVSVSLVEIINRLLLLVGLLLIAFSFRALLTGVANK